MSELIPNDGPSLLLPGTVLDGRYEILEFVGEGGFATVYKAKQLRINRIVAAKVLNIDADVVDVGSFQERFVREAQTAAKINHPNVVTIHDYGFAPEIRMPFIVMELLDGHDLDIELEEHGPLSPRLAVELFVPCLEALGRGHEAGIVHRDLKPENLFYTKPRTDEASLVVLDFGVARLEQSDKKRLTTDGQIFGTPVFAAPEWVKHQLASPAMDVYAMGLIFIEAITGVQVVEGESAFEILTAHCAGDLLVPVELMKTPLGAVLQKALALEVEHRYADAYELRDALLGLDLDRLPDAVAFEPSMRFLQPDERSGSALLFEPDSVDEPVVSEPATPKSVLLILAIALAVLVLGLSVVLLTQEPGENEASKSETEEPADELSPETKDDRGNAPPTPADVRSISAKDVSSARKDSPTLRDDTETRPPKDVAVSEETPGNVVETSVLIESRPRGAKVVRDGELLGLTPYLHKFEAPDDAAVEVRIRKSGYKTAKRSISPGDAPSIKVRLKRRGKSKGDGEDDDGTLFILP